MVMKKKSDTEDDVTDVEGRFQNYAEYNRVMRNWLVAYGIGGPILFATNADLGRSLSSSGQAGLIVWMFLSGVLLQVLGAFVNKWAAWHIYSGEYDIAHQKKSAYIFWNWVNNQNWFDFTIDLASLIFLFVATYKVLTVVSPAH
jgi:hypothetical protein